MKRLTSKHWLLIILLVTLFVVPVGAAHAQGPDYGDKMVLGFQFTLESGETLDGDLIVLGGTATIETNAEVQGDVAVVGGSVSIDGEVDGDVAVIGGSLRLGPNAFIGGDAVNFGGSLTKHPDAVVDGETVRGFGFEDGNGGFVIPNIPDIPDIPEVPAIPDFDGEFRIFDGNRSSSRGLGGWLLEYFLRGVSAIVWAVILAILGVLLVLFAPKHTERVAKTAETYAAVSFGAGCLTWVLGIPLIALLTIMICLIPLSIICLIPLSIVLALALVVGWLFGWLALGWFVGRRLMQALKAKSSTPVIEMVVGVAILTLLWRMPQAIPFIGWVIAWSVGLIAGSIGLGAVFLTRFGTRNYEGGNSAKPDYDPQLEPDPLPDSDLDALPEPEVVIELPPPHASPHED